METGTFAESAAISKATLNRCGEDVGEPRLDSLREGGVVVIVRLSMLRLTSPAPTCYVELYPKFNAVESTVVSNFRKIPRPPGQRPAIIVRTVEG